MVLLNMGETALRWRIALIAVIAVLVASFCKGGKEQQRIVLVYVDARPELTLSADDYTYLIGYVDEKGRVRSLFFTSFLLLGIVAPSGGSYETGTATIEDWAWFLNATLGSEGQVSRLAEARERVCSLLNQCPLLDVILMIPRPPPGLSLEERVDLVEWYVNESLERFMEAGYRGVRLAGFYWMCESVGEDDAELVKRVSRLLLERGYPLYWIPYFFARGVDSWKELGFSYVMLQPNFAFQDVGLERFEHVDERIRRLGIGVEMELPLYKRNPRLSGWKQSFILYLYASLKYRWHQLPLVSYYYGNDFVKMGKNPNLRFYYTLVYKHVTGKLKEEDLEPHLSRALGELRRAEVLPVLAVAVPLAALLVVGILVAYAFSKSHSARGK